MWRPFFLILKRKIIMFSKLQRRIFLTNITMFSLLLGFGIGNSAIAHHDEEAIQNNDQSPSDTSLNNSVSFRDGKLIK